MKHVAGLLALSIILAILKAAVVALVLALILALVWSLLTQPRQTIVFLATGAGACAVLSHPLASILSLTVFAVAVVVAGAIQKSRSLLLLTDGREHH